MPSLGANDRIDEGTGTGRTKRLPCARFLFTRFSFKTDLHVKTWSPKRGANLPNGMWLVGDLHRSTAEACFFGSFND